MMSDVMPIRDSTPSTPGTAKAESTTMIPDQANAVARTSMRRPRPLRHRPTSSVTVSRSQRKTTAHHAAVKPGRTGPATPENGSATATATATAPATAKGMRQRRTVTLKPPDSSTKSVWPTCNPAFTECGSVGGLLPNLGIATPGQRYVEPLGQLVVRRAEGLAHDARRPAVSSKTACSV